MIHIIDDDPNVLSVLTEILESLEYSIQAFSCPVNYMQYASSNDYHAPKLIITDIKMPRMSGYELMRKMAEARQDLKFIAMTGYHDIDDDCKELPHLFMRKPFPPQLLEENVHRLMKDQ